MRVKKDKEKATTAINGLITEKMKIKSKMLCYKDNTQLKETKKIATLLQNDGNQRQTLQVLEISNLRWNLPGETVHVEIQIAESAEIPDLSGYLSVQGVIMQVKPSQVLQPSNGGRELPAEPSALQRNVRHVAVPGAADALVGANVARVAIDGPRGEEDVLRV